MTALIGATAGLVLTAVLVGSYFGSIAKRRREQRLSRSEPLRAPRHRHAADELRLALDDAATLNSFNVHSSTNPSVHLEEAFRIAPSTYNQGVTRILPRFHEGRIVSVDLGDMEEHNAARLVDFCSGMTAMSSGWIFRVTDTVIVLTPCT